MVQFVRCNTSKQCHKSLFNFCLPLFPCILIFLVVIALQPIFFPEKFTYVFTSTNNTHSANWYQKKKNALRHEPLAIIRHPTILIESRNISLSSAAPSPTTKTQPPLKKPSQAGQHPYSNVPPLLLVDSSTPGPGHIRPRNPRTSSEHPQAI